MGALLQFSQNYANHDPDYHNLHITTVNTPMSVSMFLTTGLQMETSHAMVQ